MANKPTDNKKVIVFLDPTRMFTKGLLLGIGRYVQTKHCPWTFFRPSNFRRELKSRSLAEMAKRLKVDGVIARYDADIDGLIKAGIPVVTANYPGKGRKGLANISSDMAAIGRMGAAHLLERGFKSYAYCGYTDHEWSLEREDSFLAAIRKSGCQGTVYSSAECTSAENWLKDLERMAAWVTKLPKPVGIMACNDDRGEQVIEACRIAALHVPDDVAVVAVDNDPAVCNFSNPRLSSISLNVEDAGYRAAGLLARWMSGKKRDYTAVAVKPSRVATRESTDVVASGDEDVNMAMSYIRNNASHSFQVGDVVDHVGVSRRKLETRFRDVLGTSLHDSIRKARIERAIVLLVDTEMPLFEISRFLDYCGPSQFSRLFKRGTGLTPGEYRQQYAAK
jgi:LacI family transcriptional regulator